VEPDGFFKDDTHLQEFIQADGSKVTIDLALVARDTVEVLGLPAQECAFRNTLVYLRDGTEWRLLHRYANPLASPSEAQRMTTEAALGRWLASLGR
jgi:hypothetical protein